MCLAEGHNAVMTVRLEPAAPRSQSSTLPLSHCTPPVLYKLFEKKGIKSDISSNESSVNVVPDQLESEASCSGFTLF